MVSNVDESGRSTVRGTQAIDRSIRILRAVAQLQRLGATATRLAAATGLARPTTERMLQALLAERMIVRGDDGRGYCLGPLAYELGLAARREEPKQIRWQAAVGEVARRTRLTSYLMGRSGDEAVCLACTQGAAAIRAMPMEVGQRVPLGIGAGSLAILASLPNQEIERVIRNRGQQTGVLPGSGEAIADLMQRIARAQEAGFSISSGTVAHGVSGVGVLVPGTSGENILAITVSAAVAHISHAEAKKLANELVRAVSSAL